MPFRSSRGYRPSTSLLNPSVSKEPTLSHAEQADLDDFWSIAEGLPEEWRNRDPVPEGMPKEWWNQMFPSDLTKLIETLYQHRSNFRQLITDFREHYPQSFSQLEEYSVGFRSRHARRV